MKEFKNVCVLKVFEPDAKTLDAVENAAKNRGVFVDVKLRYGDCAITVASERDEVAFNDALKDIFALCGDKLYSDCGETLAERVVEKCAANGTTVSVAESFTGGLVCSELVSVSGASAVLYEGAITYSANAKIRRLHVKAQTLESYGAASKAVCAEMLDGLISTRMSDFAVATTGCAGPDTDEFGTPVGRCYIGVADRERKEIYELNFDEERNDLRRHAANTALWLLLCFAENKI